MTDNELAAMIEEAVTDAAPYMMTPSGIYHLLRKVRDKARNRERSRCYAVALRAAGEHQASGNTYGALACGDVSEEICKGE